MAEGQSMHTAGLIFAHGPIVVHSSMVRGNIHTIPVITPVAWVSTEVTGNVALGFGGSANIFSDN